MVENQKTHVFRLLAHMLIRQARQLKGVGDGVNARRAAQLALLYRTWGRQPALAMVRAR